jgi:hypothetical protein
MAGLLVAVVAETFLGAAFGAVEVVVAFGTRGRLSVVWRERVCGKQRGRKEEREKKGKKERKGKEGRSSTLQSQIMEY